MPTSHAIHAGESATKRRAPAGAPPTCQMAAALRYGECSSQSNPTRRGGKSTWQRKQRRAERKRAQRRGTCRVPPKTGASVAPVFACTGGCRSYGRAVLEPTLPQILPVPDLDALDDVELLDPVHHIHPVHDPAEDRVLRVEVRLRGVRDEELAPARVGPRQRHPYRAAHVRPIVQSVAHRVARSAGAVAAWIAALDHVVRLHAMNLQAVA